MSSSLRPMTKPCAKPQSRPSGNRESRKSCRSGTTDRRPCTNPADSDEWSRRASRRRGGRNEALVVRWAASHDTTSLEHQLKLRTENGRTAHAAVEWMASAIAECAARSPARSPGRGFLPVYSVAVLLAAARPDEVEGLAVLD